MTLTINDNPKKANYAMADEYAMVDPKIDIPDILKDTVREFKLAEAGDINNATTTGRFRITIPYPEQTPEKLMPSLRIYWLNPNINRWQLVGGKVNTIEHTVTIEVEHLSIFCIAVEIQSAVHLKKVIVYPNPFIPHKHKEIIFGGDNVPQENRLTEQATIRIFSINGELIKTIEEVDGDGKAIWDGRNDAGDKVASGIYIYLITNPKGEKAIGKIGVIK